MKEYASFEERSLDVARNFLQSVVVVDDKARLEEQAPVGEQQALVTPGREAQISTTGLALSETDLGSDGDPRHDLYAKPMIDKFADNGLVCAVLRPEAEEEFLEKADHATQRADIVILDWKIGGNLGGKILALISKIITTDPAEKDRLRLIAIYTGENDLSDISDKISGTLSNIYGDGSVSFGNDNFEINAGPTRVVVYAKEGGHLPTHMQHRQVSVINLPEEVIKDFSKMTEGLLANATLAALGELRNVPHRILNKFSHRLDAAYLNHRALTFPSDEAQSHFTPLLAEELESVFEDNEIDSHLDEKAIKEWLNHKYSNGLRLHKSLQIQSESKAKQVAEEGIINGVYKNDGVSLKFEDYKSLYKRLLGLNNRNNASGVDHLSIFTRALSNDDAALAEACDRELAMLMTIRSRYNKPAPQLLLGAILAETVEGKVNYFLCIQPLCDCARVSSNGIDFLFVKLKPGSTQKGMDLIIREKGNWVDLSVNFRPYEVIKLKFKPPKGSSPVVAKMDAGDWVFTTKAEPAKRRTFRWVAALKWPHAQRISMKYASQVSRVGLTESEWTRRQSASF